MEVPFTINNKKEHPYISRPSGGVVILSIYFSPSQGRERRRMAAREGVNKGLFFFIFLALQKEW